MNDRLKFRMWDKSLKKYMDFKEFKFMNIEFTFDPTKKEAEIEYDKYRYDVEQCTGSKDKNGKLIYEGDYIKTPNGAIGYLVWSKQDCGFMTKDLCPKEKEIYLLECEVIGNIHENADLLEKE